MASRSNRSLSPYTRATRAAALIPLVLPLLAAGCAKTACFKWTELEGACPAQQAALVYFQEPACHYSEIKSVDSDGFFDEDACCYDVTEWGNEERTFLCQ